MLRFWLFGLDFVPAPRYDVLMNINENRPAYLSDADLAATTAVAIQRTANLLREFDVPTRRAIVDEAHTLQNISGGRLSGCIQSAIADYKRTGRFSATEWAHAEARSRKERGVL